ILCADLLDEKFFIVSVHNIDLFLLFASILYVFNVFESFEKCLSFVNLIFLFSSFSALPSPYSHIINRPCFCVVWEMFEFY
ncbi:MAG: hypothetical protein IJO96_01400, partial [Oscillospiraceae bacterium]|nr:hypothetical protein [Oscillospiraceae bacterium]